MGTPVKGHLRRANWINQMRPFPSAQVLSHELNDCMAMAHGARQEKKKKTSAPVQSLICLCSDHSLAKKSRVKLIYAQMPSGHGKARASFFGWLSLKGNPFQKQWKKGRNPLGNWINQGFQHRNSTPLRLLMRWTPEKRRKTAAMQAEQDPPFKAILLGSLDQIQTRETLKGGLPISKVGIPISIWRIPTWHFTNGLDPGYICSRSRCALTESRHFWRPAETARPKFCLSPAGS